MKRIINISTDIARVSIPNVDSVDISRIDSIVNYSIDTIFAYILEYIKSEELLGLINRLLNKLRPEGILIIRFSNLKKISELYLKDEISDKDFLNTVANKHSVLSVDQMISLINEKFVIAKIDYIENQIVVIIQRKSA